MAQAAYQMKDKGCVCIMVRLVAKIGFDDVEKSERNVDFIAIVLRTVNICQQVDKGRALTLVMTR